MDTKSFTYQAERLRPAITAYALRICGNGEDAEDVAQDTLLKMWSMRDDMAACGSAEALAITIARNKCIDILRRNAPGPLDTEAIAALEAETAADTALLAAEQRLEIDRILRCLPENQQIILRMRHVDGMDMASIAEVLCTTEANVRTMLCRARQKVQLLFKQNNLK